MALELKDISLSNFEPLVGQVFKLGEYEITLESIEKGSDTPDEYREPFSLKFTTPEGCNLGTEVLTLSHPDVGDHDVLATQVKGWNAPTNIEICFA